ncbi:unnamed protein product [Acanthoscelides obtectus]|uniref:Uncharacterized protein n=1 Tax=Acanthoscelides obtectus TaxID=200917 RepID=A0A9P0KHB9_ACAOB|nr:unnamed protein product [Acanthoscelides obtectus]CAK1685796.1 hypothetical protein AOBTE_LOCUS35624 [Acanthoscelides obtectus]
MVGHDRIRKRKVPDRVLTVANNKSSIQDVNSEKQEISPTRASGRIPNRPPVRSNKSMIIKDNTELGDKDATKIASVGRSPRMAPFIKSNVSNRSYLSDMIPFTYVDVPDKRYDNYIPINMMMLKNGCEGAIDSSDDENDGSLSSGEQKSPTSSQIGVELAKSPLGIPSCSTASSPISSMLDEYDLTTEEEDRLLEETDEGDKEEAAIQRSCSNAKTTVGTPEQQFDRQSPILDALEEPNVKDVFKSKDIILRSDNNITITAFSSRDFRRQSVPQPNSRKQSPPKIQQKPVKKKIKYDYLPDVPIKMLSQDTGYESDVTDVGHERLSSPKRSTNTNPKTGTNSSAISSDWNNSKSITNLKVTCTDQYRVFESIPITSEENSFKVPKLPPVKRPPTRPKRCDATSTVKTNSSSSGSSYCSSTTRIVDQNSAKRGGSEHDCGSSSTTRLNPSSGWGVGRQRKVSDSRGKKLTISVPSQPTIVIADDDGLSIVASSLGGDHDVGNLNDLRSMNDCEIKSEADEHNKEESLLGEKRPFIENWVEDVNSTVPTEWNGAPPAHWSCPQTLNFIPPEPKQTDIQNKNNSVVPNHPVLKNRGKVQFKDVPQILFGVCYFKFINGACTRSACKRPHEASQEVYVKKFEKASPSVVVEAYRFVKSLAQCENYLFYKGTYRSFLLAFGHHKLQNELISCIQDLFMLQHCLDVEDGIEYVLKGMQRCGLAFLEAVEKISYNVGFMQYPRLADYLLQLMSRQSQLKSNWEVMKRLIKARGYISPQLASCILLKATNIYPPDKNICKDVYTVIVEQKTTDLSQLELKYLIPIRTLVNASVSKESTIIPSEGQELVPSPPEVLNQHINVNLHRQREIFEKSHSPEDAGIDKMYRSPPGLMHLFNAPPPALPRFISPPRTAQLLFTSPPPAVPTKVKRRSFSSRSSSSSSSNSAHGSTIEPSNSSYYVPEAVQRIIPVQEVEVSLTPAHPIVGKANYRPDYQMDKSLHNLIPESLDHIDLNESDVTKLNDAIMFTDAETFLELLEKYKGKPTVKRFITMAVAHLRNSSMAHKAFMDLVNAIGEINPGFVTTPYIKGIIEVIVFNLLHTLGKKGYWKEAANMVAKFCDWDSLVSSQFLQVFPFTMTHMGRYIYLAKILVTGENFRFAYEILQCPTLHLLDKTEEWPYPNHAVRDLQFRNEVLTDFFEKGYQHNFMVVLDLYRRIFTYSDIYCFNTRQTFIMMMIDLINRAKLNDLSQLVEDIQTFANQMDNHILRAYTAVMTRVLSLTVIIRLYEICCDRKIYPIFQGTETVIQLYNNLLDEEIYLILLAYIRKLAANHRLPPTDVTIKIRVPDAHPPYPAVIKIVRCVKDINIVIRNILKDKFNIVAKDEYAQSSSACIVISLDEIQRYKSNVELVLA